MSLVAVWQNEERAGQPSLWLAGDSRISDGAGVLLNEGGKLFSLPVICRRPDEQGFFSIPYSVQDVGLACVGGTLIYQHVYACLVPMLSSLLGDGRSVPSLEDIARTTATVTEKYVASLGQTNPQAHRVGLVLAGYCVVHSRHEAYKLEPCFEDQLFRGFDASALEIDTGQVHFFGDYVVEAHDALKERRAADEHRAPARVVRQFVDDPHYPSIGGDVQLGFTVGANFVRVTTVAPRVHGRPEAVIRFNNIDLEEIGDVGPCHIGIDGMTGV
jgi:hypothetical protein